MGKERCSMISIVNHRDPAMAEQIYELQQASYKIERDLIAYQDFPPLQVTASGIQQEPDTFLGYWESGALVGVLSFTVTPTMVDIGRLIVHPAHFRRESQACSSVRSRATPQPGGSLPSLQPKRISPLYLYMRNTATKAGSGPLYPMALFSCASLRLYRNMTTDQEDEADFYPFYPPDPLLYPGCDNSTSGCPLQNPSKLSKSRNAPGDASANLQISRICQSRESFL